MLYKTDVCMSNRLQERYGSLGTDPVSQEEADSERLGRPSKSGAVDNGHGEDSRIGLPSASILVLHLAGRRDALRWASHGASAWVDDGDGVASTLSHRLVNLHPLLLLLLVVNSVVLLESCLVEVGRGGQQERWSWLDRVLLRRSLRRTRGEGRAV